MMFEKNKVVHFGNLHVLNMQVLFIFFLKFEIIKKYFKTFNDNPNYYVSFVILQTDKNVVLNSVHSFGWFF